MKIKSLLIGMLACTALVGCTNDELIEEPVNNPVNGKNDAYISVKFAMPEASGARATSDDGYSVGNNAEQTITTANSIFLFYDVNNNYVTSGNLVGGVTTDETATGNHNGHSALDKLDINAKYGKAFIAISASNDEIDNITQVLTVVNYTKNGGIADLQYKPLSYALGMTTTENEDPSNAGFLMTTSVYYDANDNLVQTTAITNNNIKDTQAEALKVPVEIYIERVSAKVGLSTTATDNKFEVNPGENATDTDTTEDENKTADVLYNGTLTPANVVILGYTVNNTNTSTNLVKQVAANNAWVTTPPFTGWNQYANFRSYWAMGTKYTYEGFLTASTTTGEGDAAQTTSNTHLLAVKTFKNALDNKFADMYCYEHTVATDNVIEDRTSPVYYPNVTTVLVAAQILMGDATASETLYKYSGVYYNAANYQKLIKSRLTGYTKQDGSHYTEDEWSVVLSTDVTKEFGVTVSATGATVNEDDYNDIVENTEVYTDGYCYYQIPIEHLQSGDDPTTDTEEKNPIRYGVVRNHWYKLEVSAVKHIGEPVYNVNDEIPEIPEKDAAHYLAARIHVLSWHVVKQNVTLD